MREDFAGAVHGGDLGGDIAAFCERVGVEHQAAGDRARDFAACDGDLRQILGAVVVGDEVDGLAVGSEAKVADAAVEAAGEDFGFATGGRGEAQVLGGVLHQLGLGLRDVGDPLSIGRPGGVVVFAWVGGDLGEVRALVGVGGDCW